MEAKLQRLSQASKDRKRKHDRLKEALEVLQSATCDELTDMCFASSNDIITVLSAKFGWKSLFVLGRLVTKLPSGVSNQLNERLVAATVGELGRSTSLQEVTLMNALLNKCQDFLDFSYEDSLADISQLASFPFRRILFPPTTVCFECGWNLSPQNRPARVIVFENAETIPGIKFSSVATVKLTLAMLCLATPKGVIGFIISHVHMLNQVTLLTWIAVCVCNRYI